MRVLILSGSALPIRCGIADYTDHLQQQLVRCGIDTRVVSHVDARGTDVVHNSVPQWSRAHLPIIENEISAFEPDVLHMMYPSVKFSRGPFVNLLPHHLRRRFPHIPRVLTLHEYHDASFLGRVRGWVTARGANHVVVTNEQDQHRLQRAGVDKLQLIPLGNHFPVEPHTEEHGRELRRRHGIGDETLVGFVGFVDHGKGVDTLVQAAALLPPGSALLLLSGFDAAKPLHATLQRQAEASGCKLYWPGHLPRSEVSVLMQECTVMAFPFTQAVSTRRSTFVSAVVHGRASVSTGTDTGPFVSGENCLLLPEMNARTLASALQELLDDPQRRRHLGQGGRKLAAYFNWESVGAAHSTLYASLTQR